MVSLIPWERFFRSARVRARARINRKKVCCEGRYRKGSTDWLKKRMKYSFCIKSTMNQLITHFFRLVRAGSGGRLARLHHWLAEATLCRGLITRGVICYSAAQTPTFNLASTPHKQSLKSSLASIWNIPPFCVWTIFRFEQLTSRLCCCHWAPSQAFLLQYQHILYCAVQRVHAKLGVGRGWEGTAGSQLILVTGMEPIPCKQTFLLH